MKGDVFHEELPDGTIRTTTIPKTEKSARQTTANDYWVVNPFDGTKRLITVTSPAKKVNSNDPILHEILEEVITKSHRQWRSIPETTFLVLRAIEDYQSGN